jgi:septal ring factor EnvC (AmiA/AmiB activator)
VNIKLSRQDQRTSQLINKLRQQNEQLIQLINQIRFLQQEKSKSMVDNHELQTKLNKFSYNQ